MYVRNIIISIRSPCTVNFIHRKKNSNNYKNKILIKSHSFTKYV